MISVNDFKTGVTVELTEQHTRWLIFSMLSPEKEPLLSEPN